MTISQTPARVAVAGFVALALGMGVGRFAFTPILPLMQAEDILTISRGGTLASVHFLGYAMGALLAGKLTLSPRKTLFALLLAIGAMTIAMGLTQSIAIWLVARWASGVCSALILVLVSNHYVKHLAATGRADLQGWIFSGVGCGIAIAGLAMLWLMANASVSATAWQGFGIATLVATAGLFLLAPVQTTEAVQTCDPKTGSRTRLSLSLLVAYGAMGLGYVIPATYLPAMGKAAVESPLIFGWGWPVFGIAAALSTLIAARLHARYTSRTIWVTSQFVMALGLVIPALWPGIASVVVAGLCVGGTFMVITMAGIKEAHRLAGPSDAGRHIAAMTAAFAAGQMIGPVFAGWLYDATGSFSWPLLLASAVLAVTAIPLLRLPKRVTA